jgi:hypothetical protein
VQSNSNVERLRFIQAQLTLARQQALAIEAGKYGEAVSIGKKLARSGAQLSRLLEIVVSEGSKDDEARAIKSAAAEILQIQEQLLGTLEPARDRLAELLRELHRGRQLLSHYRSNRLRNNKYFDARV